MRDPNARYEIGALLGAGGMGRVFSAVHRPSGRRVAVKTLHASFAADPLRRRLLLDEATAASRLRHPNIVELLDVGTDSDGTPFLVMELVDGQSLAQLVRSWPTFATVARALDDALAGLTAAHAAGIVHRDLKPDNILVGRDGRALIADFGIARVLDPRGDEHGAMSSGGGVAGTPAYMAPEQLRGGLLLPSTDLYAFGVMLYELIVGDLPFDDDDLLALSSAKDRGPPSIAVRENLAVPDALARLVLDLLRPHPRERPRFARTVRDALASLAPLVRDVAPVAGPQHAAACAPVSYARTLAHPATGTAPTEIASVAQGARRTFAPTVEIAPASLPAGDVERPGASLLQLREPELVGRDAERATLLAAIDAVVASRTARIVFLVGGEGTGKSRLARWALAEVESRASMDAVAAGFDLSGAGLGGLRDAVARLLGVPDREGDPTAGFDWLRNAGATEAHLAGLAGWLDANAVDARATPARTAELSLSALCAASCARPVLLWLDDVGWSHDGALELLELLVERPEPAALIVATLREGTAQHPSVSARVAALAARSVCTTLRIAPLAPAETARLVSELAPLAPGVAREIAAALDGTPLLAVQLVRDWLDAGALAAGPDGFAPRAGDTVAGLLSARPVSALLARRGRTVVDSFGERANAAAGVLARAALLGHRFEHEPLRAASRAHPEMAGVVDAVLDRALLSGLLRAEGVRAYRFDHAALRDALCEAPAADAVARRDAAEALLEHYPGFRTEIFAHAAVLLRGAGELERAAELMARAGTSSGHHGDDRSARRHFATAVEWLAIDAVPEGSPRRARLELASAYVDYFAMRYDSALASVARARDAYARLGHAEGEAGAGVLEAAVLYYQGRMRASERVIRAIVTRPEGLSTLDRMRVTHRLFELAFTRGDRDAAIAHARDSLAAAIDLRVESWRIGLAVANLADLLLAYGEVAEGSALIESLRARIDVGEIPYFGQDIVDSLAKLALVRGDAPLARSLAAPRLRNAEMLGDRWRVTALRLVEALCSATLDPPVTARESARTFVAAFRAAPHAEPLSLSLMARLATALDARGEAPLAGEVRDLLTAQWTQWASAWAEQEG